MSKKSRAAIRSNLEQAIAPPTPSRKRSSHLDGLLAEYAPREELPPSAASPTHEPTQPDQPAQGNQPMQGAQGRIIAPEQPAAPVRDYMKVANSISRKAVPSGLFKGKSKQIYDFFYSQTRGAIVPRKECRLTRGAIMRGAHIGSTNTLRDNLLHLRAVGLVSWDDKSGEHDGNLYRVWIPEEIADSMHPDQADQADQAEQKLPRAPWAVSAQGDQGSSPTETTVSELPKTSFKTNTIDDEDLTEFDAIIRARVRKLAGRTVRGEGQRWAQLATVFMDIAERAAGRAEQVSSVPAFTTAVLLSLSAASERRTRKTTTAQAERPSDEAAQPLSEDLMQEQIAVLKELVAGGYPLEQLERQCAQGFSPEEWQRIRGELDKLKSS